ncbi:MAG: hypothetical protein IJB80_00825 [Clostridia bacterium]|nr:hypothetical protein [Clostridia bacterium]
MDFLDQVKKTAADVAQKVGQKSGELVEISKIKYEVYDLNSDIKKLYTEIGKNVYALMRRDELPEEVSMKCEIIEAKLAKIEALKRKEKNLKQQITCPVCHRECGKDDAVCPYCGADLAVEVDAEVIAQSGEEL